VANVENGVGTVVWMSGHGRRVLIAPAAGGPDLYVEAQTGDEMRQLSVGAAVEFDVQTGPKGRMLASNVVLARRRHEPRS
jgi:cold shock CspA family protein